MRPSRGGALLALGCAAAPEEVRINGNSVPRCWVELAEDGGGAAPVKAGTSQAQACLQLSRMVRDRDGLESLRYLSKGSALRDAECCRQYLAAAEGSSGNQSQRVYARLFVEGLLRKGPILNAEGADIRGELYYQLCWAWRYTEPYSSAKVKQILEALIDPDGNPKEAKTSFMVQLGRETGVRRGTGAKSLPVSRDIQLYAGESAEEPRTWFRVQVSQEHRDGVDRGPYEANAWGGGSDRLLKNANVLVFLVNNRGEPRFRGTQLWICNLGDAPMYLSSPAVGQSNHELLPGREEILPLVASPFGNGHPPQRPPSLIPPVGLAPFGIVGDLDNRGAGTSPFPSYFGVFSPLGGGVAQRLR